MSKRVLIVDDDPVLAEALSAALARDGLETTIATDGAAAVALARQHCPDLVVLDTQGDREGLSALQDLGDVPIVLVNVRGGEPALAQAANAGGEAFLIKPFSVNELRERVALLLGHSEHTPDGTLRVGDLAVDFGAQCVTRGDETLTFAPDTFRLLTCLLHSSGRVVSHRELANRIWGPGSAPRRSSLSRHVSSIRHALGPDPQGLPYIETVRGHGYRFRSQR